MIDVHRHLHWSTQSKSTVKTDRQRFQPHNAFHFLFKRSRDTHRSQSIYDLIDGFVCKCNAAYKHQLYLQEKGEGVGLFVACVPIYISECVDEHKSALQSLSRTSRPADPTRWTKQSPDGWVGCGLVTHHGVLIIILRIDLRSTNRNKTAAIANPFLKCAVNSELITTKTAVDVQHNMQN